LGSAPLSSTDLGGLEPAVTPRQAQHGQILEIENLGEIRVISGKLTSYIFYFLGLTFGHLGDLSPLFDCFFGNSGDFFGKISVFFLI
jgi:hypothetical protein